MIRRLVAHDRRVLLEHVDDPQAQANLVEQPVARVQIEVVVRIDLLERREDLLGTSLSTEPMWRHSAATESSPYVQVVR